MKRSHLLAVLIVVFVASSALWIHNLRTKPEDEGTLFIPKEQQITPEIERLQQYVRIDTSNPPGKEAGGAQFLAGLLKTNGVPFEIIESAPGRQNVYARIRGRVPNEGLLLLSHIDVWPSDGKEWTHPPFAGTIKFNMLYGRGVLDMKGITMCELEAFVDIARSGRKPERDIVFLATADEEQGGSYGMGWLLAHRPDIFEGVRYALNEGGITETRKEELRYFGIEIGTKMTVKVELQAPSRAQMQQARIALEPFIAPRDPERVLPEVRAFLHEIAPHRIEHGRLLDDIEKTIAEGKFWLLPRGYRELTHSIVWPRAITPAENGQARMLVTLHNLPDEDPDKRLAWLAAIVKPFGARIAAVTERSGPAPISPRNTPLFELLTREIHRVYGEVPVGSEILTAFYNDSRYLRSRGITAYGLWPFPVDFYQSQGIHSVDERVRLDWYMSGVKLMRQTVAAYAFQP
jgi:acetylornithine deacetylase/succinyl-diaminopimelate desuccinylase-like protein